LAPVLAELLTPGIGQGTSGPGSQTGLQPPPDNSFDRRADFAAAHRARKSTAAGFNETPQSGYVAKGVQPLGLNPELAQALGFDAAETVQPAAGEVPALRGVTGASATITALERLPRE